jgi:hypothetical protein
MLVSFALHGKGILTTLTNIPPKLWATKSVVDLAARHQFLPLTIRCGFLSLHLSFSLVVRLPLSCFRAEICFVDHSFQRILR